MSEENVEEHEEWARKYREAVAPYLDEEDLEAVGIFERHGSGSDIDLIRFATEWLEERLLTESRAQLVRSEFLLAVTKTKVRAFKYRRRRRIGTFEIRKEIGVFDRGEMRLRKTDDGKVYLEVTENERTRQIRLDSKAADNPGAAEVLAALSG